MKPNTRVSFPSVLLGLVLLCFCVPPLRAEQFGLFTYQVVGATVEITSYPRDAAGPLDIPAEINGRPVTSVGAHAFDGCDKLTSLTIPTSVTSIGEAAFRSCNRLTGNLVIPSGVTSIGADAFHGCSGLAGSLDLPPGITSIDRNTFAGCSKLTSVTIPTSVTSIDYQAFWACSRLTGNLVIPSGVTSIGAGAFNGCSGLTGSLTLPPGITSIERDTFAGCSNLTSVTIPSSVVHIGDQAFYACHRLTGTITIPQGVSSIGRGTFNGCYDLTGVSIPSSVTSIGDEAFYACGRLTGSMSLSNVATIGREAFNLCQSLESIILSPELNYIEEGTFAGCAALTSVVIPFGVTIIDRHAFAACPELTSITLSPSVTSIYEEAFVNCSSLTSAVFLGDAPGLFLESVFDNAATGFSIHYLSSREGFSSPTWNGYATTIIIHDVEVIDGATVLTTTHTVALGAVGLGTGSDREFTVRNRGTGELTGLAVTFIGGNADDFAVTTPPTANVAAGESTTLTVRFSPGAEGARATTLRLVSDDADENPFDVALEGTGVAEPEVAGPEIAVEQPVGTSIANGGTRSFGTTVPGAQVSLVFTIKNPGGEDLSGLTITKNGPAAADYTVTVDPTAPVVPGGSTTFTIRLDTATSGLKAAAIHITTNVPGKNPYVINLTGRALSFAEDTDGDGMNDASELLLSPLGFNWQLGQPELVQGLFINANSVGLYTPSQIQALNVETSLLIRDAATGQFIVDIGLEKSNNLQDFTAFPFLAPQTSIQPNGKIRFEFTLPDNAAFLRLQKQ